MAIIRGSNRNDTLAGLAGADQISGLAGKDRLSGKGGNDRLFGGPGNDNLVGGRGDDRLDGGTGIDTMRGEAGNDSYVIDSLQDVIAGETATTGAKDTILATLSISLPDYAGIEHAALLGAANLSLIGSDGANVLSGNAGNNTILGGDGNDALSGGAGGDLIWGQDGEDAIQGGAGSDTLLGGQGNDRLDGGTGADTMFGGFDDDTYVINHAGDAVSDFQGTGDAIISSISVDLGMPAHGAGDIEIAILTGSADLGLVGSFGDNTLIGNSGKNLIEGGDGADIVRGGPGSDTFLEGSAILQDSTDQGDEYLYLRADLDGGSFDTILGLLDDANGANAGSDHVDISDLIVATSAIDIFNALAVDFDGQGGAIYAIDLDGTLDKQGEIVPFLNARGDLSTIVFEADGFFLSV